MIALGPDLVMSKVPGWVSTTGLSLVLKTEPRKAMPMGFELGSNLSEITLGL